MFENVLNRNAKHTESNKKKKTSKTGQKVFLVATNYVSQSAMPNNLFFILSLRVFRQKDGNGKTNSENPDQTLL